MNQYPVGPEIHRLVHTENNHHYYQNSHHSSHQVPGSRDVVYPTVPLWGRYVALCFIIKKPFPWGKKNIHANENKAAHN